MSVRWLIFVGLVGGGCRDHDPPRVAPSAAELPRAAISAPLAPRIEPDPVPALPAPPAPDQPPPTPDPGDPGASKPPGAEGFAAELRDPKWAQEIESEIKDRFKKVRGAKLEDTECRHSQCQLVVAGSEDEVGRTIADLEGTRGLHGLAKTIILTAPEKKSDGTITLRAFATFER